MNEDDNADDRSELRRNQTSELWRNLDKSFELDESRTHIINGGSNLCPQYPSKRKNHWCKAMAFDNGKWYDLWASCDPCDVICDGGVDKEKGKDNRYMWTALNDEQRLAKFSIDEEDE